MLKVANDIKKIKADRLVSITIAKEKDADILYYHFSVNGKHEIVEHSVTVPKGEEVESIVNLYENAALFEAEVTELFRVKFNGNPFSGKRLFQTEGDKGAKSCSITGAFRVVQDA